MIVEYIRYNLQGLQPERFEQAYTEAAVSLKASPHCLGWELSRCVDEPDHYILRLEWDSVEGHMQGFRSSPEFQSFFQAIGPFVKNIEEMRHYRQTGMVGSK